MHGCNGLQRHMSKLQRDLGNVAVKRRGLKRMVIKTKCRMYIASVLEHDRRLHECMKLGSIEILVHLHKCNMTRWT